MLLSDDPVVAKVAEEAGVDRIFYDLEFINKRERQAGRNTVISNYDIEGIPEIRKKLNQSELLVRINPIYFNSRDEINKVISYGADVIMLPMVLDHYDVEKFVSYVNGKAKTCVMIETPQALARLDSILEVEGIDEIFIGLNDLHIGMGLTFMFELLSGGLVEYVAQACKQKKIPFGFGGIAKINQGDLPAEYIVGEHYRLGSTSVILSRIFKNCFTSDGKADINFDFQKEIEKIRYQEKECSMWTAQQHEENRKNVCARVKMIVSKYLK